MTGHRALGRSALPDRRTILLAGLTAPLMGLATTATAEVSGSFHAVAVDVSPLDRFGGGGARTLLQPALLAEMRKVFADKLVPGDARAPVLTARITNLYMSPYDGAQSTDAFGGNDNIEGDGILASGREILSTTHILTELPPAYSGSIVTPNLDLIRYQSIAYQFAYWLRREMGV